eukprot:m.321810 g.321810  ORF g.321810 m.321810 type:complete len:227 (-) comp27594_c3_seq9:6167-6847(-)
MPNSEVAAGAAGTKKDAGQAQGDVDAVEPKKEGSVDWAVLMAEEEEDSQDDESYERELAQEAAKAEEEMWAGPRAEAGTMEELEELMEAQGFRNEESETETEESEDEEEPLSLKLVAPPIEKVEPVNQLSKKELKKLEDDAFERELAEALVAAGAPPLPEATEPAANANADAGGESSSSKKKKKKKKRTLEPELRSRLDKNSRTEVVVVLTSLSSLSVWAQTTQAR